MTIWILTILLLASTAGLGWRQGAIRVGFSFVGIVLGALLAWPLGHLLGLLFPRLGVKDPLYIWLVPPLIVFFVISIAAKSIAFVVHQKVDVHYKYKTGELHQALWDRLNHRVGVSFGLLNGAAYLVLISSLIYMLSYWTYQTMTDSDPRTLKIVNRLGKDLESTRMSGVGRAMDKMPDRYYDAADIAGILYQNPLVEARFSRYPAFLGISERAEIQELAQDAGFADLRLKKAPLTQLIEHPLSQKILRTPELVTSIKDALLNNVNDLTNYLVTGMSEFDSEKLVGRWLFDLGGTISLYRKAKPTVTPVQLAPIRNSISARFGRGIFVATPEKKVFLRNIPPPTGTGGASRSGDWTKSGGRYDLTVTGDGKTDQITAQLEGNRVILSGGGLDLAFSRED